jgi:plastocyanin
MRESRRLGFAIPVVTILMLAGCGSGNMGPTPSPTPTPGPTPTDANAYILPGASNLGANAFGDEPVVIHRGERLRWRNADSVEHDVVTDTGALPEFMTTGILPPGGERAFIMNTNGTTRIHCTIHPQMVGTLIVREP